MLYDLNCSYYERNRVDIFLATVTNFYIAYVKNLVQNMTGWKTLLQ